MSLPRRAIPFFLALVFAAPGNAAPTAKPVAPPAPTGLHGFLLRPEEPADLHVFPRTPSFAWNRVAGVQKYEFELSTSKRFIESGKVWSGEVTRTPAVSVPLALPWMTGKQPDYALYARVRTVSTTGRSAWSVPFGFNMRADGAPEMEKTHYYPGLVRWRSIRGATSYEVWFTDAYVNKRISTLTTSADEREYYTFHQQGFAPGSVRWRVRAVRSVYGGLPSGLPAVSYGPWSDVNTSLNPPFDVSSQVTPLASVSTKVNANADGSDPTEPHAQTPAFLFAGAQPFMAVDPLYRVYVFTDKDCLNRIFTGAIVGGPAYSPRTSGPLLLPHSGDALAKVVNQYLRDGTEGPTAMADQTTVVSNEELKAASSSTSEPETEQPPATPPSEETPPATETPAAPAPTFTLPQAHGALVDLWDSGWPTGVYWWTVVPVELVEDYVRDVAGNETKAWIYRDKELPQEACAAGRIRSFGKESDPTLTAQLALPQQPAPAPYVSGLTTDGGFQSAKNEKPVVHGTPLVAWEPAVGAAAYEVQWSKTKYPWSSAGTVFTFGTSALLQDSSGKTLVPGDWYYRVRGLNPYVPSSFKVMSWSKEVPIVVSKPVFAVVKGTPEQSETKESAKSSFRMWLEPGFGVALPSSWKKIKADPQAKFYSPKGKVAGVSQGKTKLRFMAFDPSDKTQRTGVSVAYIPTNPSHGHDTWAKAIRETVARQSGLIGKPYCVESRLPAGPTLKCAYSFKAPGSKVVESEVSYWFDRPSKTFVLALDNPRSADKARASLRLSIAKKFKITA